MKVNISYYLDEHGWSSCWIYANGQVYEVSITHIYPEDPIEECLKALMGIMKGEKERRFLWHGEPGGDQIVIKEIPIKRHEVQFQVIGFSEEYGEEIKAEEGKVEIAFEIKKIQLIRMFYFEFKKIAELMKDEQFEINRKGDFPFSKFREFEKIALEYIKRSI